VYKRQTGTILEEIGTVIFSYNDKDYRVTYFLALHDSSDAKGEAGRDPTWYNYPDAIKLITIPQMREVLESAALLINKHLA
jgi:hypothetical protein